MPRTFSTENLRNVFAEDNKYESFRSIASSLVRGQAIYELDDNGNERRVSNADANKAMRKVFMEICGLTEDDLKSRKKRERAERLHDVEIFEVIEDDFDFRINEGFRESEWFDQFVDYRSHALGDANEFVVESNQQFIVGLTSGDHHDVTIQQLGGNDVVTVKCQNHAVKIGKDIDLIILGRYDYAKMVQKVADAYLADIKETVFTELYAAESKLPSGNTFKMTGALTAATKAQFDQLISNVQAANGTDVVIIGTKVALKNLTAITDVDWANLDQKDSIANTGRLGVYEGTVLMEVPQRFRPGTFTGMLSDEKMLIMPVGADKLVKFFDEGETEIFEITEKGDHKDDFQTYEVQRAYGAEVVLSQYFGVWNKA